MTREKAALIAEVIKALSHPVRLRLVEALASGEKGVAALAPACDAGQCAMSRHLALLVHVGIVQERREGRRSLYRLGHGSVLGCIESASCVLNADSLRMRNELKGV